MSWVRGRRFLFAAIAAFVLVLNPAVRADDTPAKFTGPEVAQQTLLAYLADHSRFTLIDARTPAEYETAHIDGAVNIPHDELAGHEKLLPADHDAPIVVYCRTGRRAGKLQAQLLDLGYTDVRVLRPSQFSISDGTAAFNCAIPASNEPADVHEPAGEKTEDTP